METVDFLSKLDIFSHMDQDELKALIINATKTQFNDSDIIIKMGEIIRGIGIVLHGKISLGRSEPDGSVNIAGTVKAGGIFGVKSLVVGEPSSYDYVCDGDCEILKIPREDLLKVFFKSDVCTRKMAGLINARFEMKKETPMSFLKTKDNLMNDPYDLNFTSLKIQKKVLVVNAGSSSLKYSLFDIPGRGVLFEGLIERIGSDHSRHKIKNQTESFEENIKIENIEAAFYEMKKAITNPNKGCLQSFDEITITGHRVVHGGVSFSASTVINNEVIEAIRQCIPLAPLHNPHNLKGIELIMELLPNASHVAVFDTAYHQSMPEHAFIYALPKDYYNDKQIRRYGFHGTNHNFVALKAATFLKRPLNELKLISCHLGNGASVCAIDKGMSVDTSMGMTPLAGLIMGTRCGDVDPGIITYLMETKGFLASDIDRALNKESGLQGLSGFSNDMREIIKNAEDGNREAEIAITMFCYRVKKYIGSYIASIGKIDALIFTGGIGENSHEIRARICQGLDTLGIVLNEEQNKKERAQRGNIKNIAKYGKTNVFLIAADEERMIARESIHAIKRTTSPEISNAIKKAPVEVKIAPLLVMLSKNDFHSLFGNHRKLTPRTSLDQKGYYLCEETVNLVGPMGAVEDVNIVGPFSEVTQFILTKKVEFALGIEGSTREFGDISGTPGITIEGLKGNLKFDSGVINLRRTIFMETKDALKFGIRDRDVVRVKLYDAQIQGLGGVLVRVGTTDSLRMYINDYEANLYGIHESVAYIDEIESRVHF